MANGIRKGELQIVINCISKEANVVLKISKTFYRICYLKVGLGVERWKLECNTDTSGHTEKSDKTNKNSKRLQLHGEIGEIRINYFARKEEWEVI